jgi:DNA-binding MarR family transcriptional regulator
MAVLNEVIHQTVRLRIVAALAALDPETQVSFQDLKELLDLTDGNLSVHLRKLEEAGYIRVTKTFAQRKPQTCIELTTAGRHAFDEHLAALKEILGGKKEFL